MSCARCGRRSRTAKVTTWSQIRKGWPDREIALFGPGAESGTFDYFTAAINGGARASRTDYCRERRRLHIVNGVAADEYALGYVGYGYYERAKDRLKSVAIDDLDDSIGQGPIQPSPQNVGRGVYRPLSRILFIYVNNARARNGRRCGRSSTTTCGTPASARRRPARLR